MPIFIEYIYLILIISMSAFLTWPIHVGMVQNQPELGYLKYFYLPLIAVAFLLSFSSFGFAFSYILKSTGLSEQVVFYLSFPFVLFIYWVHHKIVSKVTVVFNKSTEVDMHDLKQGDRIKLRGGYDYDPEFLKDPPNKDRTGEVLSFIPGQNGNQAALVKLDFQITCKGVTGDYLILELRQEGQTWETDGPVHIELCDFKPESKQWKERRQGLWVESHAAFDVL